MKSIDIKNFKKLTLNDEADIIILSAYSEEGCNFLELTEEKIKNSKDEKEKKSLAKEIYKLTNINPLKILSYGNVTENVPPVFKQKCQKELVRDSGKSLADKRNNEPRKSYRCFVGANSNDRRFGLITHEDVVSSWKCAMTKLDNPEYGIIYIE